MESNYKKYAGVYTVLSTKLKFDTYIVDHYADYYVDSYAFRETSEWKESKGKFFSHKILRNH